MQATQVHSWSVGYTDGLPCGPWKHEPDYVYWAHPVKPFHCLVRRAGTMGHLCGYVGVEPGHLLHGADYSRVDGTIAVHGGLTFAGCFEEMEKVECVPSGVWWLGFDCGHYMDYIPGMERLGGGMAKPGSYKDLDFVLEEINRLANELLGVTELAPEEEEFEV